MKSWRFLSVAIIMVILLVTCVGIINASAAPVCSPATAISIPFTKDGAGDFCWQTTSLCTYINSWNVTALEVNGTAYTNTYVTSSSIAPLNGAYTIHYVSTVAWGHFEIGAPCSGGSPTSTTTLLPTSAVNTPTKTNTLTPTRIISITPAFTATRTRTATGGPSATRTRTPTSGPSATRTNTPVGPTPTFTPQPLTATPTRTPTSTLGASPTPGIIQHLANPFVGANWYLNPDYTALVNAAATSTGGSLGAQMAKVANYNTAIWLDSVAAVNGGAGYPRSLAGHLDAALAQNANLVTLVLYDMPNRNCSVQVSDGEFQIASDGLNHYKTDFIDAIANTLSNPAYANLRIVAIIEPGSLYRLVTQLTSYPGCQEAYSSGVYVQAIQYTLNRLEQFPNVYSYLDIGHSGFPGGWDTTFTPITSLYASTINGTVAGSASVDGFVSNTASYAVINEPFLTANLLIGGQPVFSALFFEWNPYLDEATFATAWKNAMINTHGFSPSNVNMLVDTSRNGWGGSSYGRVRPTAPSVSSDLNTYVNESRVDRRFEKGDWCWCNQSAGIGPIPQANPAGGIFQAYLWVKQPGISDGSTAQTPMCDPLYTGVQGRSRPSGAMLNAPAAGLWFPDAFATLVMNAYPPLP